MERSRASGIMGGPKFVLETSDNKRLGKLDGGLDLEAMCNQPWHVRRDDLSRGRLAGDIGLYIR